MKRLKDKLPYFAAISAAIIFGLSLVFTKGALDDLQIFQLLGIRFLLASLLMTFLSAVRLIRVKISMSSLLQILPVAVLYPVIYFICETAGIGLTSASESGVVLSLVTIAVALLSAIILKERIGTVKWIYIGVSVSGVIFIVLARGASPGGSHLPGIAVLLAAVLSASLYNVLSRKISSRHTPVEITFVMMWLGAVVFNAMGISDSLVKGNFGDYFSKFLNIDLLVPILYLSVLSSIVAFFLFNYALSKMEATKTAVIMNVSPVTSVLAGIIIRGESFYPLQFLGSALILLGIWGITRMGKAAAIEKA